MAVPIFLTPSRNLGRLSTSRPGFRLEIGTALRSSSLTHVYSSQLSSPGSGEKSGLTV